MATFKTLVYSPDVRIVIEGTDVSADLVRGGINRITGGASSLQFTCSNKDLRYNDRFRRMDRVVVYMKRIEWQLVFTGYLDMVPGIQLYPSTVSFKASCTIKRLLYTYWDPGLEASKKLLNQRVIPFGAGSAPADTTAQSTDAANTTPGSSLDQAQGTAPGSAPLTGDTAVGATAPSTGDTTQITDSLSEKDLGLGNMLKNILELVGGWDRDTIKVQEFPTSFLGYINERMPEIENLDPDAVAEFKKMFDYDEATGASVATGTTPGGALTDATFTTIGPPANGSAYNDMEIVWIVTNAGWRGEDVVIGSSIIKAESSGDPDAVNTANSDGSTDRGLWQINSIHDGMFPGENRMDPAVSTKIARTLYNNRGNWNDWSTLVYHGTAQQHFDNFRAIAGTGGTAPPNSGTKPATAAPGKDPQTNQPLPGATPAADPAPSVPYGLPGGSNVSYGSPGFPDWVYALAKQFNIQASTYAGHQEDQRNEAGYAPNPQRQNRGIDWSGGVADMQRFAEYLLGIAPGTPALEQIIWMNPNTGQRIGWAGRSNVSTGSYYASAYSGHQDHVHTRQSASLDGSGSMTGVGAGGDTSGGAAGTSTFQNKLAKNIFTYLFDPGGFYDRTSTLYKGRLASVNDQKLIDIVRSLCEAGMREFQSSPSGEFLAFYPDYFGLDGTSPPKFKLEDIELKDFRINVNDDALTTHVFTQGANINGAIASTETGFLRSPGIVTVEDEFLFDIATRGSFFLPETNNAEEFLGRYGVRPFKKNYPNIYAEGHKEAMLLVAIKLFMQKWAEQYQTTVEFTFMPELLPGMRIELTGHDLIVYVKQVSHNFDFEAGFTTSAQVMAPMSASRTALVNVNNGSK